MVDKTSPPPFFYLGSNYVQPATFLDGDFTLLSAAEQSVLHCWMMRHGEWFLSCFFQDNVILALMCGAR